MRILIVGLLCCVVLSGCAKAPPHAAIQTFVQQMVSDHGFDRQQLSALLSSLKPNQTVLRLVTPKPSTPLKWYEYRDRFITAAMVERGQVFWQHHQLAIANAAKHYHVDPAIIVATLGVETRYGRVTGNFSVLQTLYTLAFYEPRRAALFRNELAQFLLLSRRDHIDPNCIKGSYAGAIGPAQFMPSSLVSYAEQGGLHSCDVPVSITQAIGDVARYYHEHGWQWGSPVAEQATVVGKRYLDLPKQHFKSIMTIGKLKAYGIKPVIALTDNTAASFFVLSAKRGEQYWLTFHNFYVISQYNKSLFYAMTVYQLALKLHSPT